MTANTNPGQNPIGYLGVIATMPPNLYNFGRAPLSTDVGYVIGSIAVYPATNGAWILTSIVAGAATWSPFSESSLNGVLTINSIHPTALGNFILAGTANQVAITGGTNTDTISLIGPYTPATYTAHGVLIGEGTSSIVATATGSSGQFLVSGGASADPAWQTATPQLTVTPVAGTSQAMAVNNAYIANSASLTTFTLPTTSAVGTILQISGSALNTGGWKVTYTTGQIIWGPAGSSTITTGNAASATAAAQSVTMICVVANTTWVITANSGTITLT